jgi:predicted nucleic acid-binding protein
MTHRVVIADAGPLIALARINSLNLLQGLFGRVLITRTIKEEILPPSTVGCFADAEILAHTLAEGWIEVFDIPLDDWKPLNPGVDSGEGSAIHAACGWRDAGDAVLLIMDDRAGRMEARSRGIALVGTAAVIGLAKTARLIPAAGPLLERLSQAGYFLGPSVIAAVLADVGE